MAFAAILGQRHLALAALRVKDRQTDRVMTATARLTVFVPL